MNDINVKIAFWSNLLFFVHKEYKLVSYNNPQFSYLKLHFVCGSVVPLTEQNSSLDTKAFYRVPSPINRVFRGDTDVQIEANSDLKTSRLILNVYLGLINYCFWVISLVFVYPVGMLG